MPTGAYTGALTLGTDRYTLTGRLSRGSDGQPLTLALTALAKNKLSLALTVTLPADGSTGTGLLQPNSTRPVALSAWPAPYTKQNPATSFAGKTTFALLPLSPPPQPAAPAGTGFGTLDVTAVGKATLKLRLADGTALTHTSAVTQTGYIPAYAVLAKNTGSLLGAPALTPVTRTLDGSLTWLRRPATTAAYAKTVLYRDGYGPLELTVLGGPARAPRQGQPHPRPHRLRPRRAPLRSRCQSQHPAQSAAISLPPLILTAKNTPLPILPVNNPAAVTLSINATAGTFTGSFTLRDPDPLKPSATVTRKVSFQGILLPDSGVGYFLLPGLKTPANAYPPTLSGTILLEPTP